jgi:hypothetical protein
LSSEPRTPWSLRSCAVVLSSLRVGSPAKTKRWYRRAQWERPVGYALTRTNARTVSPTHRPDATSAPIDYTVLCVEVRSSHLRGSTRARVISLPGL